MKPNDNEAATRFIPRTAIERMIADYPDIQDTDLHDILHYFRREATALERATIASNEAIYSSYRKLCSDHLLDRLKPIEIAIATTAATALIGAFATLAILY